MDRVARPRLTPWTSGEFGPLVSRRGAVRPPRTRAAPPGRCRRKWSLDAGRKERERDHERLRNLISRPVAEAANLAPADDAGLAWSAASLRARHPGKPHRLSLTVTAGDPSSLGVALVDSGAGGKRPRVLLDACASGPPILKEGPSVTFSWLVWPDTAEPLLIVLNRNPSASVRLGSVRLTELDVLPSPPVVRTPNTPETRTVGLYLTGANALDRFGGGGGEPGLNDDLAAARNLVGYASSCGASLVVLSERLADRAVRRALRGQAAEDSTGPDRLELVLRLLGREGSSAWLELDLQDKDALPGLPPPDSARGTSNGARARGSPGPGRRTRVSSAAPRGPQGDETPRRRGAAAAGRRLSLDRPPHPAWSWSDAPGNSGHRHGRRDLRPVRAGDVWTRNRGGTARL